MTPPILPTVVVPLPQDDLTRPVEEQVPYKVPVKRHVSIQLECPGATGGADVHQFLATFDEVQRSILCPVCRAPTEVPVQYRGTP